MKIAQKPVPTLLAHSMLALWLGASTGHAAQSVEYVVRLSAPQTQRAEIELHISDPEPSLELFLPTWRPGRYAILDPSGSVLGVDAIAADGSALAVEKFEKSGWRIANPDRRPVTVRYQIYANSLGDRTRHIDDSHAFLSGSSVFLYAPTHRDRPVRVHIEAPANWQVATGLEPEATDPRILTAANYDVLVDSPLEIGRHDRYQFDTLGARHEIVLWPPGADVDAERLTADFAAIVEGQKEVFGDLPYQRYVFLVHVGAGARGGTEHLNSTIMQTTLAALEGSHRRTDAYLDFLGLVSHELFHTWNVKQLRPAAIAPYDYQRENYSPLFWISEGTTSYYGDLVLVRAGLWSTKRFLKELAETVDAFRQRPGANEQSLSQSSFDAWVKFNRPSPDDVNTTVSFYRKGALVSLLLDLDLRRRSDGEISLDDLLRRLYHQYPLAEGGFDRDAFQTTLDRLGTGSFADFVTRYVDGTDPLPLEQTFEVVGLELYQKPPKLGSEDESEDGESEGGDPNNGGTDARDPSEHEPAEPGAFLGMTLEDEGGLVRVRQVLASGPAYRAGVLPGDEIVALEGRRLRTKDLDRRLDLLEPGTTVTLHLLRYDRLRKIDVTLSAETLGDWKLRRVEEPNAAQKQIYEGWIGQPWPAPKGEASP